MFRRIAVPLLMAGVLAVIPSSGSVAGADVGNEAVAADKTGWWNSLQGAESGTPAAPIGGVSPGFPAQLTGAPAGTFASGLRAGEIDKVAAIGVVVEAPKGATVQEFSMVLSESVDPGANNGSAAVAAINACPITAFWIGEDNARFNGRPEADCEMLAVAGVRGPEGKWTFDLKSYGQKLLEEDSPLQQNGLLLVPVGPAPETFQVTWAGLTSTTPPTFTFKATGGEEAGGDLGGGFDTGSFDSGSFGSDGGFGSSDGDLGAVTFGDDIRSDSFGDEAVGGDLAQEPDAESRDTGAGTAGPTDTGLGAEIGNLAGNLPPFALLGFLALLAVFAVVGLALSRPPAATEVLTRRGGVSRALAARRTARARTLETT